MTCDYISKCACRGEGSWTCERALLMMKYVNCRQCNLWTIFATWRSAESMRKKKMPNLLKVISREICQIKPIFLLIFQ